MHRVKEIMSAIGPFITELVVAYNLGFDFRVHAEGVVTVAVPEGMVYAEAANEIPQTPIEDVPAKPLPSNVVSLDIWRK